MEYNTACSKYLIRFRSEEMGWEVVELVCVMRRKGRRMGVSRYTREEKNGEGYR